MNGPRVRRSWNCRLGQMRGKTYRWMIVAEALESWANLRLSTMANGHGSLSVDPFDRDVIMGICVSGWNRSLSLFRSDNVSRGRNNQWDRLMSTQFIPSWVITLAIIAHVIISHHHRASVPHSYVDISRPEISQDMFTSPSTASLSCLVINTQAPVQ